MKKISLTILTGILAWATCLSQAKYEPQILILSPDSITYDKVFEKEISNYNKDIKKAQKQDNEEIKSGSMDGQPENIKIMMQNEIAYSKTLNFSKQASLIAEQYLAYSFFERFPNLLVTLKDIKCNGTIADLKKIATGQQFQYILNFPKINFYKENGISKSKISVQLYDLTSNALLLDKDFIGGWNNPGFEFACQDSTLSCTINNALSQALSEVIEIVTTNSPTLQKEKLLAQQRFNVLINDYYSKPFDSAFVKEIILPTDSNINLQSLYQCLIDESKTKFVAFFINKAVPHDFKSLNDDGRDKNVNIISSKDIRDSGFLDDIPQTYAYIVKGVKYKGKWYYQKSGVTYFEAKDIQEGQQMFFNNLQQWNFFKENSTEFNPDFWETNQFSKVKDLTKDTDWNKYGATIWETEERENRDYIGMYEIVADEMKKMKAEEDKSFNDSVSNNAFKPFYEKLKKENPVEFSDYVLLHKDEFILIFPDSKEIILNPIQIINSKGEKQIRYFLLFKQSGQIFEWTYFVHHPFNEHTIKDKIWHYGNIVMAQLETLTEWNFAFATLDDKNFWDKYVLARSGDNYKYLKQVK